jgi:PKD repeat protein
MDNSNASGRTIIRWSWDFGDNSTSSIRNPSHLYAIAGTYDAKFSLISDIGCVSDTATQKIILNDPPLAKFGVSAPDCIGKNIIFTDSSISSLSSITKWYWNFGDGSPQVIATSNVAQPHIYVTTGTFTVTLKVESASGCQSTVFSKSIVISPNPVAAFDFGNACLPAGAMQFTDKSSISNGTQSQFTYQWNFGDATTSTQQNPVHNYSATGPFTVNLTVTSNAGCTDDTVRTVNTIYAQPKAAFSSVNEICEGSSTTLTDQSTAANSSVTQWQWNFGDGTVSTQQNPTKTYTTAGSYQITLVVTSSISCVSDTAKKTIVVNKLPTANFTTSAPACETRSLTFTDVSNANSGNIIKWIWNLGDGTNMVRNDNLAFTHTYSTAGTYNVTLQV